MTPLRARRGVTLMEVIVASALVALVTVATLITLSTARTSTQERTARDAAVLLASSTLEATRALGCTRGVGGAPGAEQAAACRSLLMAEGAVYTEDALQGGDLRFTKTVDSTTYTVTLTANWDPGTSIVEGVCDARRPPAVLRRTATVTWQGTRDETHDVGTNPVTMSDVVAATAGASGFGGPNAMNLLLTSAAADSTGTISVTIPTDTVFGDVTVIRTWPVTGCLWIPFQEPGATVTLSDGAGAPRVITLTSEITNARWPE